jgi:Na+/melibiose symporter-like transporter
MLVAPAIPAFARQFGVGVAAWSLRAPFFLYAALLVVPAVIATVALGPVARPVTARAAASPRESLTVLAGALRSRAYQAAAAVNLAGGFAVLGIRSAIIPLYVRDLLHRPATWTGIGFLVFAALNAAALLPAGRAADTLGRRPVMVAGCVISAAGLLLLAVLPGLWAYLGALAVAGAGSGLLDVAPSAMLGDLLGAADRKALWTADAGTVNPGSASGNAQSGRQECSDARGPDADGRPRRRRSVGPGRPARRPGTREAAGIVIARPAPGRAAGG